MKPSFRLTLLALTLLAGCASTPDPKYPQAFTPGNTSWYVDKTIWFANLPEGSVNETPLLHSLVRATGVPPFTSRPEVVSNSGGRVKVRIVGSSGTIDVVYDARTGGLVGSESIY